jgi:hypothetical protein
MLIPCRDIVAPRTGHFFEGGESWRSWLTLTGPPTPQPGSAVIQTPEKSGFPSASRGVAADKSTAPLGVRGAPGLGYLYHCEPSSADVPANATAIMIAAIALNDFVTCSSFVESLALERNVLKERSRQGDILAR